MKKLLSICLIATTLLSVSGCKNSEIEKLKKENSDLRKQISELKGTSTTDTNHKESNDTFDQYNILSFNLSKDDRTSYSEEVIETYTVTNNSNYSLENISIDVAYYDANDNIICKDSRYNDVLLEPGKSVDMDSYSQTDGEKSKVARAEVIGYEYVTTEITPSGYNNIDVNLQTKKLKGQKIN